MERRKKETERKMLEGNKASFYTTERTNQQKGSMKKTNEKREMKENKKLT